MSSIPRDALNTSASKPGVIGVPSVENLDDALRVGRDTREIGAVKDRALQGARLEQDLVRFLARGSVGDPLGNGRPQPLWISATRQRNLLVIPGAPDDF